MLINTLDSVSGTPTISSIFIKYSEKIFVLALLVPPSPLMTSKRGINNPALRPSNNDTETAKKRRAIIFRGYSFRTNLNISA